MNTDYTGVVVSGTSTAATGSGSVTFSGASAGHLMMKSDGAPLAPYVYSEIRVTAATNASPYVGWYLDADNYFYARVISGTVTTDSKVNGVQVTSASLLTGLTAPYTIRCVVTWPEIGVSVDRGSGDELLDSTEADDAIDLRSLTAAQSFTGWRAVFGADRSAGGSATFDWFRSGYPGGFGTRDYKPVVYLDGEPYIDWDRHKRFVTTTLAVGGSFKTNVWSVMSVDLRTHAPRIERIMFFEHATGDPTNINATKDYRGNRYGGQILRDTANDEWITMGSGWGPDDETTGLDIWQGETTDDLLNTGVSTIPIRRLTFPNRTTRSYYGNAQYFDGTNWRLVCARTDAKTGWTNYTAVLLEGPDLDSLAIVAEDTTHETEGLNWMRIGGAMYANGGGTGGPHYWDEDLTYQGSLLATMTLTGLNVSFTNYGSHYCVTPVSSDGYTSYHLDVFSQDTLTPGSATKGRYVPMVSTTTPSGTEWGSGAAASNTKRAEIAVDATKVGSGGVTDFSVMLTEANLPAAIFTQTRDSGADIRAYSDEGVTRIPLDVIAWDTSANTGTLRVKRTLSSASNTSIWLEWGDAAATMPLPSAPYGGHNAYDSNWKVYMTQGAGYDRLSGRRNGYVAVRGNPTPGGATGKVGAATTFDGTDDYNAVRAVPLTALPVSFLAWFKSTSTTAVQTIANVQSGTTNANQHRMVLSTSQVGAQSIAAGASSIAKTTPTYSAGTWHHGAAVFASATSRTPYLNGAAGTANTTSRNPSLTVSYVGRVTDNTTPANREYFSGDLDELQIHDTARSSAWVLTEYNQSSSPATFAAAGAVQDLSPASSPRGPDLKKRLRIQLSGLKRSDRLYALAP